MTEPSARGVRSSGRRTGYAEVDPRLVQPSCPYCSLSTRPIALVACKSHFTNLFTTLQAPMSRTRLVSLARTARTSFHPQPSVRRSHTLPPPRTSLYTTAALSIALVAVGWYFQARANSRASHTLLDRCCSMMDRELKRCLAPSRPADKS